MCEVFKFIEVSSSYKSQEVLLFCIYKLQSLATLQDPAELQNAFGGEENRLQRPHDFYVSFYSRAVTRQDQCRKQAKELKILMLTSQKGLICNWHLPLLEQPMTH